MPTPGRCLHIIPSQNLHSPWTKNFFYHFYHYNLFLQLYILTFKISTLKILYHLEINLIEFLMHPINSCSSLEDVDILYEQLWLPDGAVKVTFKSSCSSLNLRRVFIVNFQEQLTSHLIPTFACHTLIELI